MNHPPGAELLARLTARTRGPEETRALGRALGELLRRGTADRRRPVILLSGELGAGKTTFAAGLAEGLGAGDRVKSPTFTLAHVHPGTPSLHHLDLYRLAPGSSLEALGLDELFESDDVVVIEWPDRLGDARPRETIDIRIEALDGGAPDDREVTLVGHREWLEPFALHRSAAAGPR